MTRDYDAVIAEHYRRIAEKDGLSSSSTMADDITRQMETGAILDFLAATVDASGTAPLRIADVGCGNGYTLGVIASRFPEHDFLGVELSDDLRALAEKRVEEDGLDNVTIRSGDIRDAGFAENAALDAVVSQRVLINLMNAKDQRAALDNVVDKVKPGGALLFIEAFQSPLDALNEARQEFDLEPIGAAHHNLYLGDDFFAHPELEAFDHADWSVPPNLLSTHYYVSRVLVPVLRRPKEYLRNSHLARFLSHALPPAIGDYSQLRILAFRRQRN